MENFQGCLNAVPFSIANSDGSFLSFITKLRRREPPETTYEHLSAHEDNWKELLKMCIDFEPF